MNEFKITIYGIAVMIALNFLAVCYMVVQNSNFAEKTANQTAKQMLEISELNANHMLEIVELNAKWNQAKCESNSTIEGLND